MKNEKWKHLISGLVVVIFSIIAIASTDEETIEVDIASKSPEVTVSAYEIYQAYEANEVAADLKYKEKVIQVSGVVESIEKDLMDTIYVSLSVGDEYEISSVQCFFADSHKADAASLSKGQRVTIKGLGDGYLMNVLIRGCTLVE